MNKKEYRSFLEIVGDMFPDAHCELEHSNPFELTIAVLLSAQCTDALVNKVTRRLFQKYKTPEDYLRVPLPELEQDIRSIGLYRNKAKNIQALCQMLLTQFGGQVPTSYDELVKLPGVGRKTANVVVSNAFDVPAIAVDTHVERVAKRIGLCPDKATPLQVEHKLMRFTPRDAWTQTHHRLIFFGRYHCKAQKPNCANCPALSLCKFGRRLQQKSK
ncbi:MAG: endonuclease III [Alicyclobacillus sp.]|nr:endonuclease III [Alicyclobacillus sp.]